MLRHVIEKNACDVPSWKKWKIVRTAAKRQSNCWSSIMIKDHLHSDLSWFYVLLSTSLSSASPSCHLVSGYMQCRHYTKNLCVEKLKWNWNCCFQDEPSEKKKIFRFLFSRCDNDIKKQQFFICGFDLTRSLHVQHNYYYYLVMMSLRSEMTSGEGDSRRAGFNYCGIIKNGNRK